MATKMSKVEFSPGDLVLLVDAKHRRYLVQLSAGESFHMHTGFIEHDAIIGAEPGSIFATTGGSRVTALRPTLADYVLKMPRRAQVIYPKDLGSILTIGDIGQGMRVIEAGLGSGALSLALLRAIGPGGMLVSYELREDHAARGAENITRFLGDAPPNHQICIGDICSGVSGNGLFDRVVLDLPDPWRALDAVTPRLVPGGIIVCYLPTVPQVSRSVEALKTEGYGMVETAEVMSRPWHVDGPSVRPEHRMIGHTGFLVSARKLSPRSRAE